MSEHSHIEWTDATWNPVRGCTKISPGCTHCYAETFAERFRGVAGHPYEQGFDPRLVPEKLAEPLRWPRRNMVFVNSMSDLFHKDVPDDYSIEPLLEELGPINLAGIHWVIVGGESGAGARPMEKDWVLAIREQCQAAGIPFFFKQWGGVRKSKAGRELDGRTYDEMPAITDRAMPSRARRSASQPLPTAATSGKTARWSRYSSAWCPTPPRFDRRLCPSRTATRRVDRTSFRFADRAFGVAIVMGPRPRSLRQRLAHRPRRLANRQTAR